MESSETSWQVYDGKISRDLIGEYISSAQTPLDIFIRFLFGLSLIAAMVVGMLNYSYPDASLLGSAYQDPLVLTGIGVTIFTTGCLIFLIRSQYILRHNPCCLDIRRTCFGFISQRPFTEDNQIFAVFIHHRDSIHRKNYSEPELFEPCLVLENGRTVSILPGSVDKLNVLEDLKILGEGLGVEVYSNKEEIEEQLKSFSGRGSVVRFRRHLRNEYIRRHHWDAILLFLGMVFASIVVFARMYFS